MNFINSIKTTIVNNISRVKRSILFRKIKTKRNVQMKISRFKNKVVRLVLRFDRFLRTVKANIIFVIRKVNSTYRHILLSIKTSLIKSKNNIIAQLIHILNIIISIKNKIVNFIISVLKRITAICHSIYSFIESIYLNIRLISAYLKFCFGMDILVGIKTSLIDFKNHTITQFSTKYSFALSSSRRKKSINLRMRKAIAHMLIFSIIGVIIYASGVSVLNGKIIRDINVSKSNITNAGYVSHQQDKYIDDMLDKLEVMNTKLIELNELEEHVKTITGYSSN